ncbi:MAG TPA: HAMP domain-containing sensor histidine kinase, partial [Thermoleophilaceae bacterium]|nr:HAMP domain-containing sensor histidine kinase [Thermoleophilaceae bacterium]
MSDWRGPRYTSPSLTTKLALLFSGVVAVAFGIAYFYTVPELRSNLEQQALADLEDAATDITPDIEDDVGTEIPAEMLEAEVRRAGSRADARLTVIGVTRSAEDVSESLYLVTDSVASGNPGGANKEARGGAGAPRGGPAPDEGGSSGAGRSGAELLGDIGPPLAAAETQLDDLGLTLGAADEALDQGQVRSGLGRENGRLTAQVAVPLTQGSGGEPQFVALYSEPLAAVVEAVGFIERRLLVAGVIAVLVALAGGWLVARTLARRVHRLESAAGKVADGKSVAPVPVDSEDELGQLTRAFNEMQAKLARVDRARREFIANASHELRTPIFSLGGFAELLEDEDLDTETRERFIRSMREQIDRLQRLASDLLDLSRLDAGSLEIHPREVGVSELISAVAAEFELVAAGHGGRLHLDADDVDLEAWCDPERVAQIIRVLVDNALRHTAPGSRVVVGAARRNGSVAISVADDDPSGLDEAAVQRAFERFYTGDPARGSGLGLAIARELAGRMDGELSLRS